MMSDRVPSFSSASLFQDYFNKQGVGCDSTGTHVIEPWVCEVATANVMCKQIGIDLSFGGDYEFVCSTCSDVVKWSDVGKHRNICDVA